MLFCNSNNIETMICKLESRPFLFFFGDHLRSRIICGPFWGSLAVSGSFVVGDHLRYCTYLKHNIALNVNNKKCTDCVDFFFDSINVYYLWFHFLMDRPNRIFSAVNVSYRSFTISACSCKKGHCCNHFFFQSNQETSCF